MTTPRLEVCIIGAGPRGVSVLERLCVNARGHQAERTITVHMVDPCHPGAGNVWRTDQPGHLLMNTVASQVTLFTDDSVEIDGVRAPGPSLYEWAAREAVTQPCDDHDPRVPGEMASLTPDSYATRAFYGRYLKWVFRHVVTTAPANVRVKVHRTRAVWLGDEQHDSQSVKLENGTLLSRLDAVVLAQGHLPVEPTAAEREMAAFAAEHGLTYIPPANPADVDLSMIGAGETVVLRGLGLNFFDHMALLTVGRGGRFTRRNGHLVYMPSGREPRLYAGSRRGLPYHCRGRNQKGAHGRHTPQLLTADVIEELRRTSAAAGGLDFRRDLWPLIAKEVETVYYTALIARDQGDLDEAEGFRKRYVPLPRGGDEERRLLDEAGIAPADRWSWRHITHPYRDRTFEGPEDYRHWLLETLRQDLAAAQEGNVDGPLKAALDVLRDLRNEIRLLVDHGGLTGRSHRDDLDRWYTPLNAFLSIGPPAQRIEEMIALLEAGVLDVLGPRMRIDRAQDGFFAAGSDAVPGPRIRTRVLVEARLPEPDLRRTADPLLRHLLSSGQCRTHRIADAGSDSYESGGLAVTGRPYRLIDAAGQAHPTRFAFGVPTEGVHWVTAAGIRPGVNSVALGDSDAIALAVLALPGRTPLADAPCDPTTV
ncbi:FAD/NAD(P)-binding protein [Streptomyces sp. NPDC127079]|uniref:FAD/NAD(P)-binding protein n=1 Tax=Streptomyces sp. NPDC127079 TaxID=3347132 RepID=UPI00365E9137